MDNRIPSLQYILFSEAFYKFAAMARQYHFYEEEISRMEKTIIEMNPYPQKKGDRV